MPDLQQQMSVSKTSQDQSAHIPGTETFLKMCGDTTVNLSIKYCKSLYIYTYLIRPWLDKSPAQRYKDKKREWMSHDCSVWRRYGNTYEDKKKNKLGCTADKCDLDCEYYCNTVKLKL